MYAQRLAIPVSTPAVPSGTSTRLDAEPSLIAADEPPAFEEVAGGTRRPVLLVCDHASRRIPRALRSLGLPEAATWRHIAWDIGAAELTRAIARRLEVPAVLAGYSRLVIDCNRRLDDPTSIVAECDGQIVPGNLALSEEQRAQRARECFEPYHRTIDAALERMVDGAQVPVLISIHSFTPVLGGRARPWHCGVLWDRDPRLALPVIDALRAEHGLVVGDNEPYSGRHPEGFTVDAHAQRRGWPHLCIEVRQDLIENPAGVEQWAERLVRVLTPLLDEARLYRAAGVPCQGGGA